jgi:hypothetical protein
VKGVRPPTLRHLPRRVAHRGVTPGGWDAGRVSWAPATVKASLCWRREWRGYTPRRAWGTSSRRGLVPGGSPSGPVRAGVVRPRRLGGAKAHPPFPSRYIKVSGRDRHCKQKTFADHHSFTLLAKFPALPAPPERRLLTGQCQTTGCQSSLFPRPHPRTTSTQIRGAAPGRRSQREAFPSCGRHAAVGGALRLPGRVRRRQSTPKMRAIPSPRKLLPRRRERKPEAPFSDCKVPKALLT